MTTPLGSAATVAGDVSQTVTLPFPPTGNHGLIPVRMGKATRLILSPEMRAYKAEAEKVVVAARLTPYSGPVALTINVYRPRKVGDADKGVKQAIDALTGHAFKDDKQVVEYYVFRRDDKENPRVVVTIESLKGTAL